MKIRPATMDDIESLLRMGREFLGSAGIKGISYSPSSMVALAGALLSREENALLVADDKGCVVGMIGGTVAPNILQLDRLEATEFFWWVDEDYRGGSAALRLLDAFKDWAKARGARVIRMAALEGKNRDQVESIYARLGYAPVERHFCLEV